MQKIEFSQNVFWLLLLTGLTGLSKIGAEYRCQSLFSDLRYKYTLLRKILQQFYMEDAFVECPVCNGDGVDLEGYICWKCKGHGQIEHKDK
jgi:hypothetical protein